MSAIKKEISRLGHIPDSYGDSIFDIGKRYGFDMKQESVDKIMELFEKDGLYVARNFKLRDLAEITGEDLCSVKKDFEKEFGYSFREMVSIWRACRARDLLISGKVPYRLVWKFSGYKSIKEFEREWGALVI